MTSCSINFATKKIYYQAAVSCLALWCAEDSFWTLRRVVAVWHKSMQTATHVLPSVSRENHGIEHVTTCSVWVLAFSFLLIIVWAPNQGLGVSPFRRLLAVLFHVLSTPWLPRLCRSCPRPWALLGLAAIPRAQCPCWGALLGNGFSGALPGTRCNSGPSWWLFSAPSPTPPCLPHIWFGAMSCTSSLWSRFIPMFLPCPRSHSFVPALSLEPCQLPSYYTWFKSSSKPLSFTPP